MQDLNDPDTTMGRRRTLKSKLFLRKIYIEWYHRLLQDFDFSKNLRILEVGSGAGFIKEINDTIITSDILKLDHCDIQASAEQLPFKEGELDGIVLMDAFHHFPDCSKFLNEVERVLKNGGKLIMVEPANTFGSRLIYKFIHHEPFDAKTETWQFASTGPLSGANIALPWIVFSRDLDKFHQEYPSLKLVRVEPHTPFRYLLSGGFSSYTFAPGWSFGMFTFLERLLSPIVSNLAMFQTIEIRKNGI